jgi:hypothetical protein
LKCGIKGMHLSDEPFHLFRYLDEQSFASILAKTMTKGASCQRCPLLLGKRVEYRELIGQTTI